MYAGTQRAAVRPSTVSQYDILNYFIYSWVIQSIGSQSVGRAPAESHKINLRGQEMMNIQTLLLYWIIWPS